MQDADLILDLNVAQKWLNPCYQKCVKHWGLLCFSGSAEDQTYTKTKPTRKKLNVASTKFPSVWISLFLLFKLWFSSIWKSNETFFFLFDKTGSWNAWHALIIYLIFFLLVEQFTARASLAFSPKVVGSRPVMRRLMFKIEKRCPWWDSIA